MSELSALIDEASASDVVADEAAAELLLPLVTRCADLLANAPPFEASAPTDDENAEGSEALRLACARLGIKTKPPEWINQLADKGASIGVSLGIINAPAHARRLSGSTAREHNQTGPPSPLRRGGAKAQARRSAEPTRTRAEGGAIANRDRADTPEQVAFGCV